MPDPNATPPDGGFKDHPERINMKGRPPKWTSTLVKEGYKKSEVVDCIQALMSLDELQLKDVNDNEQASMLERIVAAALLKSFKVKSLWNIETLLSRVYGKPKESLEAELKGDITITLNLNDNLPDKSPA